MKGKSNCSRCCQKEGDVSSEEFKKEPFDLGAGVVRGRTRDNMLGWQPPNILLNKKFVELEEPDNDEAMSDGDEGLSEKVKDEKEELAQSVKGGMLVKEENTALAVVEKEKSTEESKEGSILVEVLEALGGQ